MAASNVVAVDFPDETLTRRGGTLARIRQFLVAAPPSAKPLQRFALAQILQSRFFGEYDPRGYRLADEHGLEPSFDPSNAPSSVCIGDKSTVTTTPRVIHGEVMYQQTAVVSAGGFSAPAALLRDSDAFVAVVFRQVVPSCGRCSLTAAA